MTSILDLFQKPEQPTDSQPSAPPAPKPLETSITPAPAPARKPVASFDYAPGLEGFFTPKEIKESQELQAKRENSTREATFRTHGVQHYTDAFGTIQPERHEDGGLRYTAKTFPTTYDEQGRAIERKRDERGTITAEDLDKDAPYGTHPDRPHELYRQNKHRAWDYVGTVDELAKNPDPRVQEAVAKGKKGLDDDFAKTAATAFDQQIGAATEKKRAGALANQQYNQQVRTLDDEILALEKDPAYSQKEGGIFGQIGARPTAAAQTLQDRVKSLRDQQSKLVAPEFDPKVHDAELASLREDESGWRANVSGFGLETAIQRRRALLEQAGQDVTKDPVLSAINNRRTQLGMPEHDAAAQQAAQEDRMRKDPRFARQMAAADTIKAEHEAEQQTLSEQLSKLPPGPERAALVQRSMEAREAARTKLAEVDTQIDEAVKASTPPKDATPEQLYDWMNSNPLQKRAFIAQLSPEERRAYAQNEIALAQGRADNKRRADEVADAEDKGVAGQAWDNLKALGGGASQAFSSLVTAPVRLYGMFFQDGAIKDRGAIQWADLIDEGFRERYLKGKEDSIMAKVGNVLGSGASFLIPGGAITSGLRLAGAGANAMKAAQLGTSAILGSAMNAASTIPESVALGLDDQKTWERFAVGAGLGATEAVGIGGLLAKFDKLTAGSAKRFFTGLIREGVEEGAQEAFQSAGADLYDKWRNIATQVDPQTGQTRVKSMKEILGDTAEASAYGALGGLIFGGLMSASASYEQRRQLAQAAQRSSFTPTPEAVALGAQDFSNLSEQIKSADPDTQMALIEAANRSAGIQVASDEIAALPQNPALANLPPEQIASTQAAARGIVRIATGQPMESLTAEERAAVESPTPDGLPRVELVGGQPVITQGAIDRLRDLAPAAADLIGQSESERRAQLTTPPPPEGQGPAPTAAGMPSPATQPSPAAPTDSAEQPSPDQNALGAYEVEVEGEQGPRIVQATSEEEAAKMVASDPATRGLVRGVVQTVAPKQPAQPQLAPLTPDADAETFYQHARNLAESSSGQKLNSEGQAKLRATINRVQPALARWSKAFDSVGLRIDFRDAQGNQIPTAGVATDTGKNRILFSLRDLLKHDQPGLAEHSITEEAIHAVSEKLHNDGQIDLDGMWRDIPESVKDLVRGTASERGVYEVPLGEDTTANRTTRDTKLAREFWRLYVQGSLNVGPSGWQVDGEPIVTEQVTPSFLRTIRNALARLFQTFQDMRRSLLSQGASPELVFEVERARDITLTRIREIDGAAQKSADQTKAQTVTGEYAQPGSRPESRPNAGDAGGGLPGVSRETGDTGQTGEGDGGAQPPVQETPAALPTSAAPSQNDASGGQSAPTPQLAPRRFRFRIPPAPGGGPDLLEHLVNEYGKILSPAAIRRTGREPGQEYDGAQYLPMGIWRNTIFTTDAQSGNRPDEAAQALYDLGLLPQPSPDALWEGLRSAIQTRRNYAEQSRARDEQQRQGERFTNDALTPDTALHQTPIPASELNVGDVVTVGEETFDVTGVSPDDFSVILSDGRKYGVQRIEADQVIYGELERQPGEEGDSENVAFAQDQATAREIEQSANATYELLNDETLSTIPGERRADALAFRDAAAAIDRRTGESSGGGTQAGSGRGNAPDAPWHEGIGRLIPAEEFEALPLVSNHTSEHEVRFDPWQSRAIKRTLAGFYGQVPTPENGKLGRRNATPAEYLRRMAVQTAVFKSDLRLEGASISDRPSMIIGQPAGEPSIVISQDWLNKTGKVTMEAITSRLESEGFQRVPRSYFGWYRPDDGVVIVDAKPDNFVMTSAGLVPLDLQMTVFSPEQMERAGLGGASSGIILPAQPQRRNGQLGLDFGTRGLELFDRAPEPATPRLRPGERSTGDLFQGEDQPFNLSGETAVDGDRVVREREQAERDAAEARENEARQQQGLFSPTPVTGPSRVLLQAINATGDVVEIQREATPELLRELAVYDGVYNKLLKCLEEAA